MNGIATFSESRSPLMAPGVSARGLTFSFGSQLILDRVSFDLVPGQLLTILGQSGCGKTTLLKLIGGYLAPSSGELWVGQRNITNLSPTERQIGMVFQHYALFPHRTAWRNISFGLEVRHVPWEDRRKRVQQMLELVGLTETEAQRRPGELSGGQQQRVALARALIFEPELLLLDEPMANLDQQLRLQLRHELKRLQRETNTTTILVTHDRDEALAISDQLAVMAAGRLVQCAPPETVYRQPNSALVARLLGEANLIPGRQLSLDADRQYLIRPEQIQIDAAAQSCQYRSPGQVISSTYQGSSYLVDFSTERFGQLRVKINQPHAFLPGELHEIGWPAEALWAIPQPQ